MPKTLLGSIITIFLIAITYLQTCHCIGDQNFTYSLNDVLTIPFPQIVDISNSLTTSSFQYIDEGEIQIYQNFNQNASNSGQLIKYNIIYFNLQNQQGRECYFDFFSMKTLPSEVRTCQNFTINQNNDFNITCVNFTGCVSEYFLYNIDLARISYKQNIIMIQNSHSANSQLKLPLLLSTATNIYIMNSNGWFYWSVALTCCLLLSLVLLTGVVLYWSLNYRKAQRALQELRLTEVDNEVSSLRKSLRNSLMKQQ